MRYEWLAYIVLMICFITIVIEFIYLYVLSARSERKTNYKREVEKVIFERLDTIVASPTEGSMMFEIDELKKYVGNEKIKMRTMCDGMDALVKKNETEEIPNLGKALYLTIKEVNPEDFYRKMLYSKDLYDRSFACRKLADFNVTDKIEDITKLLKNRNKYLHYNASMALTCLGDEDGVFLAISDFRNNFRLSHRVIVELLDNYTSDIVSLGRRLLEINDDYIKSSVVKALAKHRIIEFENYYIQFISEENINLKIAAIKALGLIGKSEYEHDLIMASKHKEWMVRSAAVKAMRNIKTQNALNAVVTATGDKEWWVRYNAAETLTEIDEDFVNIEKVLKGYDKYASEAVIHALYQKCNMREA